MIWSFISIGALVIVGAALVFSIRRSLMLRTARQDWGTNDLQLVGLILVMSGIVFGDDEALSYGLVALGLGLSIFGALRARRSSSRAPS